MYKSYFKRYLDIILSTILLIILSPIFLICIIILSFTGEREIFYLQQRVGFKNKKFKIIKFATMVKNSPNLGAKSLTLRNDPRVLPFGKILRISKINELPQLINVLVGDMSVIGPRPQMLVDFLIYPKYVQKKIYKEKPGITGINQIFFRDEEKLYSKSKDPREYYINIIAPKKGKYELWYLSNLSLITDLKIIFSTILVILLPNTKIHYKLFKNLPN